MALIALPGGLLWFANPDRGVEDVDALAPGQSNQA